MCFYFLFSQHSDLRTPGNNPVPWRGTIWEGSPTKSAAIRNWMAFLLWFTGKNKLQRHCTLSYGPISKYVTQIDEIDQIDQIDQIELCAVLMTIPNGPRWVHRECLESTNIWAKVCCGDSAGLHHIHSFCSLLASPFNFAITLFVKKIWLRHIPPMRSCVMLFFSISLLVYFLLY